MSYQRKESICQETRPLLIRISRYLIVKYPVDNSWLETCSDMRASAAACTTAPGVCNPKRAIHALCGSLNGRDALTTRSWTSVERHF